MKAAMDRWLAGAALLSASSLACSSETGTAGITEPLRVFDGQFIEGELPGRPPLTEEELANDVKPVSPNVTSVDGASGVLLRGDPLRVMRGRASTDAVAVGVRFAGRGSGYWVRPVGAPDAANEGQYTFTLDTELSRALPPGLHELVFAAIDREGSAGTQLGVGLCVASPIPDNLNACAPKQRPPSTVVSLSWDTNADLDLQVFTPDGVLVEPKHPTTAAPGDEEDPRGALDRDSNHGCSDDGVRRENLVFEDAPAAGAYFVYANLFDACGEPSVRFDLTLHGVVEGDEPDTFRQIETYRTSGVLLAAQANGGSKVGLLITKFTAN